MQFYEAKEKKDDGGYVTSQIQQKPAKVVCCECFFHEKFLVKKKLLLDFE